MQHEEGLASISFDEDLYNYSALLTGTGIVILHARQGLRLLNRSYAFEHNQSCH